MSTEKYSNRTITHICYKLFLYFKIEYLLNDKLAKETYRGKTFLYFFFRLIMNYRHVIDNKISIESNDQLTLLSKKNHVPDKLMTKYLNLKFNFNIYQESLAYLFYSDKMPYVVS